MKLNKKLLSIVSVGALGLVAVTPVVNAAESDATIEFIAPTTAPDILNPDFPDEPLEEEQFTEDEITDEVGVLTLDLVSNLDFGQQELSPNNEIYEALNDTTPFAQVTDVRGTEAGWQLMAELGSFTQDEGETNSLSGAAIQLNSPETDATSENFSEEAQPDAYAVRLESGGDAAAVTVANQYEGMGSWITRWPDDDEDVSNGNGNVLLEVPASVATQGTHEATITWTLYDAPSGGELVDNSDQPET